MLTTYGQLQRQAATIGRDLHLLRQDRDAATAPRRSPVDLAASLGVALDEWQRDVLATDARDILLLCSRQAGKSTVAAMLALHEAVEVPGSLTLIVCPAERQSKLLLRTVRRAHATLRGAPPPIAEGHLGLELRNGSEVIALPGREVSVRGYAAVDLLIADEAARIDDALNATTRPMLAVSGGRSISLTSPFGRRGWFWEAWEHGGPDYFRRMVTAADVPRIPRAWLEQERRRIGDWWFDQEYGCVFQDAEGVAFTSDDIRAAFVEGIDQWDL